VDALLSDGTLSQVSAQTALFFSPNSMFRPLVLANAIAKWMSSLFTNDPTLLQLPPDAPPEIPRVLLQQDGVGQLSISYQRADLVLNCADSDDWSHRIAETAESLARAIEASNLTAERLGLVLTFRLGEMGRVDELRSRYIRPGKLEGAYQTELAWLRKTQDDSIAANRWVRIASASESEAQGQIVIDLNTPSEISLQLSADLVRDTINGWLEQVTGGMSDVLEW